MEIITLLTVSTLLRNTPFAEGSGCFALFRKYKEFINEGPTIQGTKFDPLEILNYDYWVKPYPTCNSIRAVAFFPCDNEVAVTILKMPWNKETTVNNPEKTVEIIYQKTGRNQYSIDTEKIPQDSTIFGLESQDNCDVSDNCDDCDNHDYLSTEDSEKISKIVRQHLEIVQLLKKHFVLKLVYIHPDKSYAIFRSNYCIWIGWNSTEAQAAGLTREILEVLSRLKIPSRHFPRKNRISSQTEEGESSGSVEEITHRLRRAGVRQQRRRNVSRLNSIEEDAAAEDETSEVETSQNVIIQPWDFDWKDYNTGDGDEDCETENWSEEYETQGEIQKYETGDGTDIVFYDPNTH